MVNRMIQRRDRRPRVPTGPESLIDPSTPITAKQARLLAFIVSYIVENFYPPTFDEIGLEMGITTPNGVRCGVDSLIKKGYLSSTHGLSRTLRPAGMKLAKSFTKTAEGRRLREALALASRAEDEEVRDRAPRETLDDGP